MTPEQIANVKLLIGNAKDAVALAAAKLTQIAALDFTDSAPPSPVPAPPAPLPPPIDPPTPTPQLPEFALGVTIAGMEMGSKLPGVAGTDYATIGPEWFALLKAKGITHVRLPFKWERLQPSAYGTLDAGELGRLKQCVVTAAANGIDVLLDCHNFGVRQNDGGDIDGALLNFWTLLNAALPDTNIRGFQIMNEPNARGDAWPVDVQAIVNALRAAGVTRTIYVNMKRWSSAGDASQFFTINDPLNMIVYVADAYATVENNDTDPVWTSQVQKGASVNILRDRISTFGEWCKQKGVRGCIGELGVGADAPRDVLANAIAYAKSAKLEVFLWSVSPWWPATYAMSLNSPNAPQWAALTDAPAPVPVPVPPPAPQPAPVPVSPPAPQPAPVPVPPPASGSLRAMFEDATGYRVGFSKIPEATLASLPQNEFPFGDSGWLTKGEGATGARGELGVIPDTSMIALAANDPRAERFVDNQSKVVASMPIHWPDIVTGRPIVFKDRPTACIQFDGWEREVVAPTNNYGWEVDGQHQPDPLLIAGLIAIKNKDTAAQARILEEFRHYVSWNYLRAPYTGRGKSRGLFNPFMSVNDMRGAAWTSNKLFHYVWFGTLFGLKRESDPHFESACACIEANAEFFTGMFIPGYPNFDTSDFVPYYALPPGRFKNKWGIFTGVDTYQYGDGLVRMGAFQHHFFSQVWQQAYYLAKNGLLQISSAAVTQMKDINDALGRFSVMLAGFGPEKGIDGRRGVHQYEFAIGRHNPTDGMCDYFATEKEFNDANWGMLPPLPNDPNFIVYHGANERLVEIADGYMANYLPTIVGAVRDNIPGAKEAWAWIKQTPVFQNSKLGISWPFAYTADEYFDGGVAAPVPAPVPAPQPAPVPAPTPAPDGFNLATAVKVRDEGGEDFTIARAGRLWYGCKVPTAGEFYGIHHDAGDYFVSKDCPSGAVCMPTNEEFGGDPCPGVKKAVYVMDAAIVSDSPAPMPPPAPQPPPVPVPPGPPHNGGGVNGMPLLVPQWDAAGKLVHLDPAPVGYSQIAHTSFRETIIPKLPAGYKQYGSFESIKTAWSGMARMGNKGHYGGGGHMDGSCNGWFAVDFENWTQSITIQPSIWTEEQMQAAKLSWETKNGTTNNSLWTLTCMGIYPNTTAPDGKPPSYHTYRNPVEYPGLNCFFVGTDRFNLDGTTHRKYDGENPPDAYSAGTNGTSLYDHEKPQIYTFGGGNGRYWNIDVYHPETDTFQLNAFDTPSGEYGSTYSYDVNCTLYKKPGERAIYYFNYYGWNGARMTAAKIPLDRPDGKFLMEKLEIVNEIPVSDPRVLGKMQQLTFAYRAKDGKLWLPNLDYSWWMTLDFWSKPGKVVLGEYYPNGPLPTVCEHGLFGHLQMLDWIDEFTFLNSINENQYRFKVEGTSTPMAPTPGAPVDTIPPSPPPPAPAPQPADPVSTAANYGKANKTDEEDGDDHITPNFPNVDPKTWLPGEGRAVMPTCQNTARQALPDYLKPMAAMTFDNWPCAVYLPKANEIWQYDGGHAVNASSFAVKFNLDKLAFTYSNTTRRAYTSDEFASGASGADINHRAVNTGPGDSGPEDTIDSMHGYVGFDVRPEGMGGPEAVVYWTAYLAENPVHMANPKMRYGGFWQMYEDGKGIPFGGYGVGVTVRGARGFIGADVSSGLQAFCSFEKGADGKAKPWVQMRSIVDAWYQAMLCCDDGRGLVLAININGDVYGQQKHYINAQRVVDILANPAAAPVFQIPITIKASDNDELKDCQPNRTGFRYLKGVGIYGLFRRPDGSNRWVRILWNDVADVTKGATMEFWDPISGPQPPVLINSVYGSLLAFDNPFPTTAPGTKLYGYLTGPDTPPYFMQPPLMAGQ